MQSIIKARPGGQVHRIKRKSMVGRVILVCLGIEFLFFAAFTAFDLPTATAHNLNSFIVSRAKIVICYLPEKVQETIGKAVPKLVQPTAAVRYTLYVPEAPAALFIGYTLGWPIATIAAGIFFVIGLFGPLIHVHPFAGGGGTDYYMQPGFGYLVGMVISTCLVGLITSDRRTSLSQIFGVAAGLFTIHFIGLAYMLGLCLFFTVFEEMHGYPIWSQWVFEQARNLTWYSLPYDILFALVAIGISFPLRWLANILVAPDIGFRSADSDG